MRFLVAAVLAVCAGACGDSVEPSGQPRFGTATLTEEVVGQPGSAIAYEGEAQLMLYPAGFVVKLITHPAGDTTTALLRFFHDGLGLLPPGTYPVTCCDGSGSTLRVQDNVIDPDPTLVGTLVLARSDSTHFIATFHWEGKAAVNMSDRIAISGELSAKRATPE